MSAELTSAQGSPPSAELQTAALQLSSMMSSQVPEQPPAPTPPPAQPNLDDEDDRRWEDVDAEFESILAKADAAMDNNFAAKNVEKEFMSRYDQKKESRPTLPPTSSHEVALKQCLEEGCVKARTAAYVAFGKECAPGSELHKKYNECTNNAQRNEFRLSWAKSKYESVTKGKSYKESYNRISAEHGTYLPFYKVWEQEGFDHSGLEAAVRHCQKCLRMGGPWLQKNPLTERIEFLHYRRSLSDIMSKSWAVWREEQSDKVAKKEVDPKKPKPEKPKQDKPEKMDPPRGDNLREAQKAKTKYQSTMSLASSLVVSIERCAEWDWANNDKQLGQVRDMMRPLEEISPLCRAFLSQDIKKIRGSYTAEVFDQGLREFIGLEPRVVALQKRLTSLQNMHRASQQ